MDEFGRTDRVAFPPVGSAVAASLLGGVLLALLPVSLPPPAAMYPLLVLGAFLWWRRAGLLRPAGSLLVGFALTVSVGQVALDLRLPHALEGEDLGLVLRVEGLPQQQGPLTRFDARVLGGEGEGEALAGRRLRLSWYGRAPALAPGERWAMQVRLRRPRGVLNPGGFDSEKRAAERRLAATGYVRQPERAQRLSGPSGLDAWRAARAERIEAAGDAVSLRFVRALALGDTRGLDERDWETLRATGLSHLLAISGFHVGVVAGFGALLAGLLYRLFPRLGLRLPRPQGTALMALAAAASYAAAAGFSLPTLRALLMVAVALGALLLRRPQGVGQSLVLALIALLLADPLAVLGAGFWLSFLGVAWLLWCLPREREAGYLRPLLQAQGVAALGLLPLTVWFFGQASVAGPLANLVGIPVITLLVVPLSLLGLLADTLWAGSGSWLWWLAASVMDLFWPWMERLAGLRGTLTWLPEPRLSALLLALAGAFWLLMPRGVPARPLALLLFLPLLWPAIERPREGAFDVAMFDVGQGLAVLVRTANHSLLYDTGPGFGDFDMGRAAVVPALRALGVRHLDTVVVSHGDADHAGGLDAVRRAYPGARVLAPAGWRNEEVASCLKEDGWQWDDVRFTLLHPPEFFPYLGNEASCVLRVEGPHGAALLPGDIGAAVERRLLREQPERLPADILLVPHHGSRTSSSEAFVRAVSPSHALYGVGHRNRFGFPRAEVVARYSAIDAVQVESAAAGYVRLRVGEGGVQLAAQQRRDRRRWWHEP